MDHFDTMKKSRFEPDPDFSHVCKECGYERDDHLGAMTCPHKCPFCGEINCCEAH